MKWILFLGLALIALSNGVKKGWSGCWTRFTNDRAICEREFGYAWQPEDTRSCGYFSAGKEVLCAKNLAGCKQTSCVPLPQRAGDDVSFHCRHLYGKRLPVVKDRNRGDCNIFRYHITCCPK